MSLVRKFSSASRLRRPVIAAVVLLLICAAGASDKPVPGMEQLYRDARRAYESGDTQAQEKAAAAIVARADEAVKFLASRLDLQAESVRDADELKASGILVTINLLGRMNSFPAARLALTKLKAHPVAKVWKWAKYALARTPQTRPARPPRTTRPTTTQPTTVRVEGDRIYVGDDWFRRPKVNRPPLPEKITKAFVIPIHGPITGTTFKAIRRKVIRCKTKKPLAEMIIFEMKTPGGESRAMSRIVRLIVDDLRGIYTVAYVNPEAYSAGAIISLACDELVLSPTAVIGDAMPIMIVGGQLKEIPEKERGKFESAARAEVRMLAERNGHNQALCEAMITITMEIWLVRNRQTRELKIVNAKDWRGRVHSPPPTTRPAAGGVASPDGPWEYVETIDGPGELVTMHTKEALRLAFARHVFEDMNALRKHYNITAEPTALADNWSESIVAFLTSPVVMSILLFIGILAAYAEIHSPGFGVPGSIAIVCFAIVFGSRYLTGMAQWWEIALFFVGILLLLAEIFVTPGFGVLGVTGILCCIAALLAMLVPNAPTELPWPDTEGAWEMLTTGVLWLMAAFVAATAAGAFLARYLPKVPIAGRLVLAAPAAPQTAPATEDAPILDVRVGQVGKVTQICRPVGKIQIGDQFVDAIADGAFLEVGTEVVVLRNEGNRVVVEAKV